MAGKAHEERRLVTSLFIDVVGSTELTIRLGPERLKGALDEAFTEIRGVIERQGGTVEKYIGDAIYALFGAPLAHPDDPERALRAADGVRAWARSRANAEIPFDVRVGLETGEAIVDLAAAADTKQQMSVGAVVNTAARLQQRAEPGQVLVGPVLHEAAGETATFFPMARADLKGLGSIEIWALDEIRGTASRRRLPFVGREAELELLQLARRRSKTRSVLALVSGPPGQGKTRLVDEFLARETGLRVLTARCRPGGEVGALAPLRELLLGDRDEEALDALVAEAVGDDAERGKVREGLAHSAGIRASTALAGLAKDERDDELLNAWRKLVRGLAASGPLAIWVEDLHWAAPEVTAIVDRLSLAGEPVLVIATARPEFAEEAGLRPGGDRFFIELEGLEAEAASALAASAGGSGDDAARRAEGNPLFIVELARTRDASGELPLTLQGALGARLDDLDPEDRALLANAAVIGETFAPADVAFLAGADPATASRRLGRLAERHYLDALDGRYRFHHSLLRDVAYNRLLAADRLRLHARYARGRADRDDAEVLAHHWWAALGAGEASWVWQNDSQLGAMRAEAFAAHVAAGRRQGALLATSRAAALLERAYDFAPDERARGEAKHVLADIYAEDLQADHAWAAYLAARRHYAAAGAPLFAVSQGALKIRMRVGAFRYYPPSDEIIALAAEAEQEARASGDPAILARTLVYTAFQDMDPSTASGDPAKMIEALELSKRADPATRREILGWHASDLIRDGQLDRALAVLDELGAIPIEVGELDRMEHERGRALLAFRRGDLAELERRGDVLVAASRRMGPHLRTHADNFVASAAFARGDWGTVMRHAAETDRLMQSAPLTAFCGQAAGMLAYGAIVHGRSGHADDARALGRRLRTITHDPVTIRVIAEAALVFAGDAAGPVSDSERERTTLLPWLALRAVAAREHDEAGKVAAALEAHSVGGARFYAALAQAMREESERDRHGTAPTHVLLKEIGYVGWSDLLSHRVGA